MSLLEGKRPAEIMVVRFSSGNEAILVVDVVADTMWDTICCWRTTNRYETNTFDPYKSIQGMH